MANIATLKFLVVDDMLTMRKIVAQQLRLLGVTQIVEAQNGALAWEVLQREKAGNEPVQFVVSDWNMPEMTGIDFLKKVRANPDTKNLAFVLVTAESEGSQVGDAIKAGVDSYVV